MVKRLFSILFLLVLSASLTFADTGFFLGFEHSLNRNKVNLKSQNYDLIKTSPSYGIKFGYGSDILRFYEQFTYNLEISELCSDGLRTSKNAEFVIGVDFTPYISRYFKFMTSVYGGLSAFKLEHKSTKQTSYAPMIGGKVGFIYDMNGHAMLEIGGKYDIAFHEFDTDKKSEDFELEKISPFISYTYKF